jgi:hypothetical protein
MVKKDDKARVRVFFGEIEGDNATIRDGLRSIAEAVNKTFQQETRTVKVITVGGTPEAKQLTAELEQQIIDVEANVEEPSETYEPKSEERRERAKGVAKAKSYQFIKDLNLRPEGKKSLREFFSEKKPTSQQDELTVVLYYLHRILEVEGITTNHVYTGLKDLSELGVRVPKDIAAVYRNTATRKGHVNSSNHEDLKMATPGDNYVEHDLPNNRKVD